MGIFINKQFRMLRNKKAFIINDGQIELIEEQVLLLLFGNF